MLVALWIIAAAITSTPIFAIVLVSVASRREDRAWTLAGPPPSPAQAGARHLVSFHSAGVDWLLACRQPRSPLR